MGKSLLGVSEDEWCVIDWRPAQGLLPAFALCVMVIAAKRLLVLSE